MAKDLRRIDVRVIPRRSELLGTYKSHPSLYSGNVNQRGSPDWRDFENQGSGAEEGGGINYIRLHSSDSGRDLVHVRMQCIPPNLIVKP